MAWLMSRKPTLFITQRWTKIHFSRNFSVQSLKVNIGPLKCEGISVLELSVVTSSFVDKGL